MSGVRGAAKRRVKQHQPSPPLIERPRTRAWVKQEEQESKSRSIPEAGKWTHSAQRPLSTQQKAVIEQRHEKPTRKLASPKIQRASGASGSSKNRARQKATPTTVRGELNANERLDAIDLTTLEEDETQEQDSVAATIERESCIRTPEDVSNFDAPPFTRAVRSPTFSSDYFGILDDQAPVDGLPSWYLGATAMQRAMRQRQTRTQESTPSPSDPNPKDGRVITKDKLDARRIMHEATTEEDTKLLEISSHFRKVSQRLTSDMLAQVLQSAREFVTKVTSSGANEDCASALWALLETIDVWKPEHRLPHMKDSEFDVDLRYCKDDNNEAVLQRTVMISIISRFQFDTQKLFSFNCEGQFSIPKEGRIPVRASEEQITMPKPDLAVFFRFRPLKYNDPTAPFPNELKSFMRPDGGYNRCFPFLFIEAKKSTGSLDAAYLNNMHSASQALFNIFQWFLWLKLYRASHSNACTASPQGDDSLNTCNEDTFFEHVRVFSIALNAEHIDVRIHRAEQTTNKESLVYYHEHVCTRGPFEGSQACHLVQTILHEYAEKQLLDILRRLYRNVSEGVEQMYNESKRLEKGGGKRLQGIESSQATKRGRSVASSQATFDSPAPIDMQSSFGITNGLRLGETDL